jgi:putative transposase
MRRALVPQHLQPRALAKMREIAAMLNAIHASEDLAAAREKAIRLIDKLHGLHLSRAAELVETAVEETLT